MKRLFTLVGIVLAMAFYTACAGVDVDTSELASLEETPPSKTDSQTTSPSSDTQTPAGQTSDAQNTALAKKSEDGTDDASDGRLTVSQLSRLVESEIKKVAAEQIIFNSPQQFALGSKRKIEVRVANTIADDVLNSIRAQGVDVPEGATVTAPKVSLSGEGFEINGREPVSSGGFTQWDFDVTPKELGEKVLSLGVTVAVGAPNSGEREKAIQLFDKKISVAEKAEFAIGTFLENYLLWIVSVIVIAGVAGYIARELLNQGKSGKAA